jgi:putative transposase
MTADPRNDKPRKDRLRRLDRIFARCPIYFVTACTFNRRLILARPEIEVAFSTFARGAEQHGAYVGAYVLMPDHVHLFVGLEQDRSLSHWMKSLKNALSKPLRAIGIASPHWQKGFFDHVLRGDESFSEKWEYVRDNPVRAGLVETWERWPYRGEVWPLECRE